MSVIRREEFFKRIEKVHRRNRKVNQRTIAREVEEAAKFAKQQEKKDANKGREVGIRNSFTGC